MAEINHVGRQPAVPAPPERREPAADRLPGSDGEHLLQERLGTVEDADRFYDEQMLDHLNDRMREFVGRQEMFFLATADRFGECDSSFRAGPPGFLRVLDERTLIYPEYRGNGVHASLGNISENPHAGVMLIDFEQARIGLHVNGRAYLMTDAEARSRYTDLPDDPVPGRQARVWVRIEVEEAYIHCAKHIPHLVKSPRRTPRDWGTDDYKRKGGDFFGAAREAAARRAGSEPPAEEREPVSAALPAVPGPSAEAWRQEAMRLLAEAERRGSGAPPSGWFGGAARSPRSAAAHRADAAGPPEPAAGPS
ncbi:pyridoxamine 5'-phosphate oxidase family protein [Streptomyces sp. YIM 98790]|uniref:pyridoxamine 5'-phosphate oxidase family protein n=1 Tax=Streptomyces sp. YIM 98790 TaxID=2689077 RepID=UPI00140C05A2|nr:pyridoxamine 5'-phosphate oxidase family protein [Streptomyces sp. YIM 98790]